MKRFILLGAALLLMPLQAMASGIIVEDAWVRLPPPVADTAAGYMTIRNNGDKDIEITGVETAVAENPEFHAMEMHGDMMNMKKLEPVIIPAHGGINFTPSGNHLMLIGLTEPLEAGQHIMITLQTSEGESIMVHAEVRDMRGGPEMDHGQSGHDMKSEGDNHHGMHH